jgi:hypothetical protein
MLYNDKADYKIQKSFYKAATVAWPLVFLALAATKG